MLVKICGLTRREDAAAAERHGADFLGVIMAGGPRNLTVENAARVLGAPRAPLKRAVVFGSQSNEQIASVADRLRLDVVQLHNDPSPDSLLWLRERLSCAIWPVLRVEGKLVPADAVDVATVAGALLLDAKVAGQLGGTGIPLDWGALKDEILRLRASVPALQLILAGGLNAGNVSNAYELLQPDVVDVSSGVESSAGIKDDDKVTAFLKAARSNVDGRHQTRHQQ